MADRPLPAHELQFALACKQYRQQHPDSPMADAALQAERKAIGNTVVETTVFRFPSANTLPTEVLPTAPRRRGPRRLTDNAEHRPLVAAYRHVCEVYNYCGRSTRETIEALKAPEHRQYVQNFKITST